MKSLSSLCAFLCGWLVLAAPQDPVKPTPVAGTQPPARATDVETTDALVDALYGVISGPPGVRDWDRLRSLFRSDAMLLALGVRRDKSVAARPLTVDDYIRLAGPGLEKDGFFEIETGRDERRYGDLAQVLSGYRIQLAVDEAEPRMRGVNALQLVHAEGRWWIASLAWEQEQDGGPIATRLRGGG